MRAVLLVILTLVYTSYGQFEDDELQWGGIPRSEPPDPFKICNRTICDLPCEGAGWPPACPNVPLSCSSGCACVAFCPSSGEQRSVICYETKYCLETRRRFLRRRTTVKPRS